MENEGLVLELNVLMEEYRSLKAEIVSNLNSARQIATLTFTAVGILITVSPVAIERDIHQIFLIVPLFFFALAWSQLRYTYLVLDMGHYLRSSILPNVQRLLREAQAARADLDAARADLDHVLAWERPGKGPSRLRPNRLQRILFLPVAGANYAIPLLAALVSLGIFLFMSIQESRTMSSMEIMLVVVNILAFFYSGFWGFRAELKR